MARWARLRGCLLIRFCAQASAQGRGGQDSGLEARYELPLMPFSTLITVKADAHDDELELKDMQIPIRA